MNDRDDVFLSRWSRRKALARQGIASEDPDASSAPAVPSLPSLPPTVADPLPPTAAAPLPLVAAAPLAAPPAQAAQPPAEVPPKPAPPTLADVVALTRESDFSRFVAPDVEGTVRNAALKKLFADPHFNVMDGLDIYIDDYSRPDPLPLSSLRKMAQAAFLGLIQAEAPPAGSAANSPAATGQAAPCTEIESADPGTGAPERDEDADLRLQPHDAAGCGGAEESAAADTERQP